MPPSRRSSSSRSSSSRSSSSRSSSFSSRSSSSHSYSSSSSRSYSSHSSGSSYRSSPVSHSTTSHRPSSHSTSSHTKAQSAGVPFRTRLKQPEGYNRSIPGYQAPTTYHCRKHDYVYYAMGWTDAGTGMTYQPGYYDEDGRHYDDIALKDKSSGILTMKCEYCGSTVKTKWTEGAQPTCPNCGAGLEIGQADELLSSYNDSPYVPEKKEKKKWHPVLMVLMGLMLLGSIIDKEPIIFLLAAAILVVTSPFVSKHLSRRALIWSCVGIVCFCAILTSLVSDDGNKSSITQSSNSIYVDALGRRCQWYDAYDSYYDPETDCYFAYSDISDAWQYWYEGISSDYGDYGWMEYDEKEIQWYIEASDANWIKLPGQYDTASLWYISEPSLPAAQAEPVHIQDINSGTLFVEALGRSCEWSEEFETYYDKETDCYFWYNTEITPACWQYWYEGISSDFGDYGWMEYDEPEDVWYIEASEDNWIVLPKGYNTESLWHIEE